MISRTRLPFALALAILAAALAPAGAAAAGEDLRVTTNSPDFVTPGGFALTFVNVHSVTDSPLSGNLEIDFTLPPGLSFAGVENFTAGTPECQTAGQETKCLTDVTGTPKYRVLGYKFFFGVEPGASGVLDGQIEVKGAGTSSDVTVPISMTAGPSDPFEIKTFEVDATDKAEGPETTAAAFPAAIDTSVELLSESVAQFNFPAPFLTITANPEAYRDVVVHVPPGVVGYPTATAAKCTAAELSENLQNSVAHAPACPPDSQIGMVEFYNGNLMPLYNIVAPPGTPAEFGFNYEGVVTVSKAKVRPGDNGIDIVTENISSSTPIPTFRVELWGAPSDSSHDRLRTLCTVNHFGATGELCPSSAPDVPFLRMPTSCGGPLNWGLEVDTWQHPGLFHRRETSTPAMGGCENVPFDPSLEVTPSQHEAHSPSGLEVNLSIPQENGPGGLSQADLRRATLALPEGVSINHGSADGLQACSDAQLRLGLEGPSQCPEASKLGTVELTTPLLDHPVDGSVYLRTQASQDPASGDLYRLAVELRSDQDGVAIKLPGSLAADRQTGKLTATFDQLPQLPFESMRLALKTGPRAPLATPRTCGTYAAHAELTGWNGKTVALDPSFEIDQNCAAAAFAPGFSAGATNPHAGGYSPFSLRVTRSDAMPNVTRIDATLPEGELAKLAGVGVCPQAGAASGDCPSSSLLGTATVGVGYGASPLYLPQAGRPGTAVYLAGPYKGALHSMVVKVPAQAGPFDVGVVAVRSAIEVDPVTTQISVLSDALPQIVGGIPVAYRDIRVDVDRPGFTLNPTSCEPMAVTGEIGSSAGGVASVSDRFQVSDCGALGFKPKLALALKGGTTRGKHPALRATLTMPGGGANIGRASVALPHSEFLDQGHIRTICTRVQFAAGSGGGAGCPPGSVYGRATATSPLLDQPLSGPVYLRSSDNPLPDLVAALDGQIHVDLVGRIDSVHGGIRTTFAAVPDAPVSKFVLSMQGGKKGLLQNSTDICRAKHRATARFDGQNGKAGDSSPLLKARCGGGKGRRK